MFVGIHGGHEDWLGLPSKGWVSHGVWNHIAVIHVGGMGLALGGLVVLDALALFDFIVEVLELLLVVHQQAGDGQHDTENKQDPTQDAVHE